MERFGPQDRCGFATALSDLAGSPVNIFVGAAGGQPADHLRADPGGGFELHIAAVKLDKALDEGEAQLNLGLMYAFGKGVPQDYSEAYIWHSLAVSSGQLVVEQLRDRMAAKLTRGQLGDAQREARMRWGRIQARKNRHVATS